MPELNVDLEKKKKRPALFSERGCIFLFIGLPILACGLCYASVWLFARYGGEWVISHNAEPLVDSTLIATARFSSGGTRVIQRLYAVPGKLQDYDAPQSYRIIRNGRVPLCDTFFGCGVDEASLRLYVLFGMSWNLTHAQHTGLVYDIGPQCDFAYLYDTHQRFYQDAGEHFNPAAYDFPENSLALLTQTCYYAID